MEIISDSEDYVTSEGVSSLLDIKQEDEINGFHVGDFVWGKEINCHQWLPGQIYDSSDASDLALKQMQKGRLLVAYFGDKNYFAWCELLQLKPFLANFKEFSKTSDPRAVEEAVREIGEHVEHLLLVCDEVSSPLVAMNYGIKEGVIVPVVRREIVSSLVLQGLVLEDVKSLAKKTVGFGDLLEIEVLKRKISVFYRCRGRRFGLTKFDEDRYIFGHDDSSNKSSCQRSSLRWCSGFARKKRKCSSNLGDVVTRVSGVYDTENAELKQVEEFSNGKSLSSSGKRKKKRGFDDRVEKREESNHLEEIHVKKEDAGIEILSTPLASSVCKRVKVEVSPSETLVQSGKRQRKKSKYLSPEYMTDFSWRPRKCKIEPESNQQIRSAERMTKNAIDLVRLKATPTEMLDLIREAALGTQEYSNNSSCDMIREFVSLYRTFTYHNEEKQQVLVDEKEQIGIEKEEVSGVELFIMTNIGYTLPSKDDLMKIYKKFGALDKERSFMFNSWACVAFLNVSDGEEAFNKSIEKCPFPTTTSSTVTFKLKYPSCDSLRSPNVKNETEKRRGKGVIEIECLKEKLEEIRALLDQSEGGVTEELKMKLVDKSRNLLDKVRKMIVSSS